MPMSCDHSCRLCKLAVLCQQPASCSTVYLLDMMHHAAKIVDWKRSLLLGCSQLNVLSFGTGLLKGGL